MSHDDSEVIDLDAICARASAKPAGDLTPPDLFSVAPPAFTTDISEDGDAGVFAGLFAKKTRGKLTVAAAVAALLVVSLVFVGVGGGSARPPKASATKQLPPEAPAPLPDPVAAPVVTPEVTSQLPAPPTTGAPAVAKAPPRFVPPATAMKARAPASGGPKMTKVQSTGIASR